MALAVSFSCAATHPAPGRQLKFTGQSARPVPIRVLTVGKTRSQGVRLIVDEYIEKLKCYCTIEDIQLRSNPKNSRDVKAQIEHEDTSVMNLIRSDDWVVMLDERGLDITSEKMAELICDAGNRRASSLLFCIGGPYGHGKQLRQRANGVDNSQRTEIPPLTFSWGQTHAWFKLQAVICGRCKYLSLVKSGGYAIPGGDGSWAHCT